MENFKNELIENLAKEDVVGKYIKVFGKDENPENLKDLEQDIYLKLLEMRDEFLQELIQAGKVNDFVFIMVKNNIMSKSSPYYRKYKKNNENLINIDEYYGETETAEDDE